MNPRSARALSRFPILATIPSSLSSKAAFALQRRSRDGVGPAPALELPGFVKRSEAAYYSWRPSGHCVKEPELKQMSESKVVVGVPATQLSSELPFA